MYKLCVCTLYTRTYFICFIFFLHYLSRHRVWPLLWHAQCGKMSAFLSLVKYFVKTFRCYVNQLISRNFWGKIMRVFHSQVWKSQKFSLMPFWQKFRETNCFTKEITRVDLTKYFFIERYLISRFFHTTVLLPFPHYDDLL